MNKEELKKIAEGLIETFDFAGKESIRIFKEGLKIEIKDDKSPVSNGDLRVNDLITKNILKLTPNIPIVSEETVDLNKKNKSKIFWLIDPIDGTANYFRGLDECCVSIALMENDEALIGVIYNFNNDQMYTAIKDQGAFLNNTKISVSDIASRDKASITTGFPASESIESSMNFLEDLKGWKKVRMFGSAALSCAYVASGKCDYYAEKGVYLWDIAAGICLVREAGGCADFKLIDKERYEVVFSNNLL